MFLSQNPKIIIYPVAGAGVSLAPELVPLRKMLVQYFSLGEMRTLAFDLGISCDDLPGSTRLEFAESLITYCYRNNKLAGLLQLCRQQRSFVEWSQVEASINSIKAASSALSPEQLQAAVDPWQQKKGEIGAQLAGVKSASVADGGAVAQGSGATAVGDRGKFF